ncbi:unnamed protein product [Mycena citricolor]|uniref:Uncharacterized protein n=1 Tax=Mycena citricolor TaxID=2018698 RepID=A0AAD2GYQ9_9AGAR|nr:unnamed protein product [Mycena citricolor]
MFPQLFNSRTALISVSCAALAAAAGIPQTRGAVQLAVSPQCGALAAGVPVDVNVGLAPLSSYKTIVAFGGESISSCHSYTGGGATNGPTWVELLASSANAQLINYAATGSVVDATLWPHVPAIQAASGQDYVNQGVSTRSRVRTAPQIRPARTLESTKTLDPASTLYVMFYGIEDYAEAVATGSTDMSNIAGSWLYTTLELEGSGSTLMRNVLFVDNYGLGKTSALGDTFKQYVFTALGSGHRLNKWNVGFVSLDRVWAGVLYGAPGYKAFGYTDVSGNCVQGNATCADPAHTFMWSAGNPTAATHAIMAEYVEKALTQCVSQT